jgi:four helix bundle protein
MGNEIKDFDDLNAWKKAHGLAVSIYEMTKQFPKEEMFGLISQIRRSATSVGANISEGFARFHAKDKIRFYYHARASAAEVMNHLYVAKDLGYCSIVEFEELYKQYKAERMLINGLIRSIENNINTF